MQVIKVGSHLLAIPASTTAAIEHQITKRYESMRMGVDSRLMGVHNSMNMKPTVNTSSPGRRRSIMLPILLHRLFFLFS